MIIYFADRQLNILGQASTELPKGLVIMDDRKTEDIETGVAIFECKIPFDDENRLTVESFTEVGNYVLRSHNHENEFYTIIDTEIDTKKRLVYIYAEDDGMDLLNEVVGAYEADKAYPISHYIEKYASGAGFEIGINEVSNLTRQLSWDGESTATERIASVATQFDGCEVSYSFDIDGLLITKKYINIYKERGKDVGITLRLNQDIDSIVTTKSIANLATALYCTGATPEDKNTQDDVEPTAITLKGYAYDDGDFYVDGDLLKSREALKKWARYLWKNDETQQAGGHIVKLFSYDTLEQKTLCAHAITELKRIREIDVNYEVDIRVFPENAKIGDRINIVDDGGELYVSARILQLESSVTNQEHKATLGEYLIKSSGIHQKVIELAAQFAKVAKSSARALYISQVADEMANTANEQAEAAANDVANATALAEEATQAANDAAQAAQNAQIAADNAQAAVDNVENKVEGLETSIVDAEAAAEQARQAAATAETKAAEARQAAEEAEAKANETASALTTAQETADNALAKANTAQSTADQAVADAQAAATTAAAAKLDAENAQKDIDALSEELTTLENTMVADYARKTDLTETEARLQTKITQNAAEITSTATKVQEIDETANNAADQAAQAQTAAEAAQSQADQATADAQAAQTAADNAAAAASLAQGEADTAKAAAATAKSVADKAEADLEAAKADLATVSSRVDSTEEDIVAAQEAVTAAQTIANNAKADAEEAAKKAAEAQSTADTAVTNAANAQTSANEAASNAALAQKTADEAKGDASAAQAKADEAAATAAEAQRTADTAKTNAATAQATADSAAQAAANAQTAADEADEKAAQAAADLATAQQNLANVTSRVDATEEEVEAAQAAVVTAQAAADKAQEEAEAAQATADTAKANAATAQTAADNAKAAADAAQADAEAAQKAADAAQADVDALAVRVTSAETKITQNSEQIALMATKTEVAETLGGYYTIEQTDAAITAKANEINLSVDSKIEGVQVGGRNLLKNSRHIWLSSNNSALYPVSYSTETENGREFRRYIRTETSLTPTTMSLYSAIPVTEITDVLTGQEITFSFLIRCSHSTTTNTMNVLVVNGMNNSFGTTETHNIGTEWQRISLTATVTIEYERVGSNLLRFNPLLIPIPSGEIDAFYIDVCEWKIEKGNKATDWTPAPEDIDSKFSNYSTKEEMQSAIDLKAEGIFSTVKSTYTTKEDFANLDVGGRNLVRDSSLKEKTNLWTFSADNTYSFLNGYCEVFRDTASGSRTFNSQSTNNNKLLKPETLPGGTFTLSAEIKLLDGYSITDGSTLFYRCNTTELSSGFQEIAIKLGNATTEWKKVHSTFTFGEYNFDGSCQVCIALENAEKRGICVRNIKLEKGNKATDWTPAPEDVDSGIATAQDTADLATDSATAANERITSAESLIQQLSNCISMLVTDENGESLMTQTEDGWTFSMKETSEAVSSLIASLEELQKDTGSTQATVDVLQQAVIDHGQALEYVNIATYEDEPCIELGESDSDFKLMITNTRIMFMNGANVPTYINTNGLVTQNIEVKGEIVQGGYVMLNTSDGGWGLLWKGVSG